VIAASYLGGSDTDSATQGVVGADGSLYVVGLTASPDFPGASFSGTPQVRAVTHSFVSKLRIADPSQVDSPCMARVVQNSASFAEGAVAPGELVTFRGLGMAPDSAFAPGPPVRFGAIQVLFDGVPAPVLYAQSRQINTQVPWELAGHTSTQVHVEYNGVPTNSATLPLAAAAPGLFSRLDGTSQGVILNQDGSLNSPANPAARGSVVAIFGTGGGALSPPGVTGGTWPASLSYFSPQPTVKIGPSDAVVTYAGSAPFQSSGVFQINVRVPDGLSAYSFYYVLLTIGGATNAPGCCVTIAVQ
jgi:uncharacterized protein (TIGR03437 family)